MSCGCFGVPGSGTNYEKAKQDAKKRAQEENKTMAIWQENGQWCIGEANQAASNGKPVREVFSKH